MIIKSRIITKKRLSKIIETWTLIIGRENNIRKKRLLWLTNI